MTRRALLLVSLAGVVLMASVSCSRAPARFQSTTAYTCPAHPEGRRIEGLEENMARWTASGPRSYRYVASYGQSTSWIDPLQVTVKDGKVIDPSSDASTPVTYQRNGSGPKMYVGHFENLTIDGWFQQLLHDRSNSEYMAVSAQWNPDDGRPEKIFYYRDHCGDLEFDYETVLELRDFQGLS